MFFIGSFKIPQFINLKKLMEKKKKEAPKHMG